LRSAGGNSGTLKSSAHTRASRFELLDKYYRKHYVKGGGVDWAWSTSDITNLYIVVENMASKSPRTRPQIVR